MHWYLLHTKPKQEKRALLNLQQQGYECYFPVLPAEKMIKGKITLDQEPLFPRYLFIRLSTEQGALSWAPIRSTKGVHRLVSFGTQAAKVDDALVAFLKEKEIDISKETRRLFEKGDKVLITQGAFAGLEGVYQMNNGDERVMVLIEFMSKPVVMGLSLNACKKIA